MTYKLQHITIFLFFALLLSLSFLVSASSLHASDFTATVDVEGGTVIAGEEANLVWYVTGGPASCSINHGVGDFEVTENPQGGSVSALPPESGDPFIISCSRGAGEIATDDVVVIPNPAIDFRPRAGGTELVSGLNGKVGADLIWDAEYATECSEITYINASTPGIVYTYPWYDYVPEDSIYTTNGQISEPITESRTYFITCTNSNTGAESTESVTMTVTDPPPPAPVIINVNQPVDEPAFVERDEVRQYGEQRYEFTTENATYCNNYQAYNLHEYPNATTALPEGYDTPSQGKISRSIPLRLATSTILEVTCGRPEVEIGGIMYPATSTTLTKTFLVSPGSASMLDGGDFQYGTVTVSITPDSVERNAISGTAFVTANVVASNVDYCNFTAYRVSDGVEYNLVGWTQDQDWNRVWSDDQQNLNQSYTPAVATSSELRAVCVNIFDRDFGTEEDAANAITSESAIVTVTVPEGPAIDPNVWLYSGPSVQMTADDIWDNATVINNLEKIEVSRNGISNRQHIRVDVSTRVHYGEGVWGLENPDGEITFTFDHPHGAERSDIYNIHMRHCDEVDGAVTYNFFTENGGLVGSHTSDLSYPGQSNRCEKSTESVDLVAEGVVLADGEEITVTCSAAQNGTSKEVEWCEFSDLYFGTGSGDRVVSVPEDSEAPRNTLIWMSEGATGCYGMRAETPSSSSYTWSNSTQTYGSTSDAPIGAVTTYNITCNRPIDFVETSEDVEVITSENPDIPLESEETASDEASYDFTLCWEEDPTNTDTPVGFRSAAPVPVGYVQAPAGFNSIPDIFTDIERQCIPYVDLSVAPVKPDTNLGADDVANPGNGTTFDGVDNVNGTYDLSIIPFVQNLVPSSVNETDAQALPANSQISYSIEFTGGSLSLPPETGFYNELLPPNTVLADRALANLDIPGVPFGNYNVEVRFNVDGSPNYPDDNSSNNIYAEAVNLAVPTPHMTLRLDDSRAVIDNSVADVEVPIVRLGETVRLNWSVNVNYPLSCTLTGPGIGVQDLTLGTVGSNPLGVNPSIGFYDVEIRNSSEYELECVEETFNHPEDGYATFNHTGIIEVVPNFQEF